MPYRVGIVGAARRHQGTGPYVARTFNQLGHEIIGVVGTSHDSVTDAITTLANQYEIHTRGYTSLHALLEDQSIDILAICSPPSTHLQYLDEALDHGLQIFCEKPLWWPLNKPAEFNFEQYENTLLTLIDRAHRYRRIIHVNTQWPYTLRDFFKLYPAAMTTSGKLEQFAMHLCPQSRGPQMLVDAASHGLSMLYQLAGAGDLADISCEKTPASDFERLTVRFNYIHTAGTTGVTFGLTNTLETPKPASYQINGYSVNRIVALPGYQIQLQSDHSTIDIMDPLETSVRDFIANIEADLECDTSTLILGTKHLYSLIDACR